VWIRSTPKYGASSRLIRDRSSTTIDRIWRKLVLTRPRSSGRRVSLANEKHPPNDLGKFRVMVQASGIGHGIGHAPLSQLHRKADTGSLGQDPYKKFHDFIMFMRSRRLEQGYTREMADHSTLCPHHKQGSWNDLLHLPLRVPDRMMDPSFAEKIWKIRELEKRRRDILSQDE